MSISKVSLDAPGAMAPTLSLLGGISIIAGAMIGTGVFSTGGTILSLVGSPGMAIIMWVLGGVVAFCGGFTYVEWGLMIPESGGDMPYLEYVYRRPRQFFSFLYCWCRVVLVHTGYTSALASVVGSFVLFAFQENEALQAKSELYGKLISVLALVVACGICALSNTIASRSLSYITVAKFVILTFVVVTGIIKLAGGFPSVPLTTNFSAANAFAKTSTNPSNYAFALYSVFFCYDGFANLAMCIGELKNPRRNVPRAIIGGISVVAILYVLANIAYLFVLPADVAAGTKESLAAVFATQLYGPVFGHKVMSFLILFSAFGCCLCITFAASRVIVSSAERRFLPFADAFTRINSRTGTPLNAIAIHFLISLLLLVAVPGNVFGFLVNMTVYSTWVFYTITTIGLLILRRREPAKDRPFRVTLLCPIVVIVTGIFLSVFPFARGGDDALAAGLGLACIVIGVPVYYFVVYRRLRTKEPGIV